MQISCKSAQVRPAGGQHVVNAGNKNTEVSAGNGNAANTVYFEATLSYPGGITIREIMKPITEKAESCGLKAELVQNYDPVVFCQGYAYGKSHAGEYQSTVQKNGDSCTFTGDDEVEINGKVYEICRGYENGSRGNYGIKCKEK